MHIDIVFYSKALLLNAYRIYYLKSRPRLSLGSGVTLSLKQTSPPQSLPHRTNALISYSSLMMRAKK